MSQRDDKTRIARVEPMKSGKQYVSDILQSGESSKQYVSDIPLVVHLEEPEKDGTELDFDVTVFSQDEADFNESNSSDFWCGRCFLSPVPSSGLKFGDSLTAHGCKKHQMQNHSYETAENNVPNIIFESCKSSKTQPVSSKMSSFKKVKTREEKRKLDIPSVEWSPSNLKVTPIKKMHCLDDSVQYFDVDPDDGLYISHEAKDLLLEKQIQNKKTCETTDGNTVKSAETYADTTKQEMNSSQLCSSDDDCVLQLCVDGRKGTSPIFVQLSKSSQSSIKRDQSVRKDKVSDIYFEMSPSERKVENERKTEMYLEFVTKKGVDESLSGEKKIDQHQLLNSQTPHTWMQSQNHEEPELQSDCCDYKTLKETKFDKSGFAFPLSMSHYKVANEAFQEFKLANETHRNLCSPWRSDKYPDRISKGWQERKTYRLVYGDKELMTTAYNPGFIDSHCHLDFLFLRQYHLGTFQTFISERSQSTEEFPVSFEGCVTVFCEPWTFRKVGWWEDFLLDSKVWGAFGCHPHHVSGFQEEEEKWLRHAMKHEKVVALGEIGLDYSKRNNENVELQQKAFRRQLEIALEFEKPLVIHCRDAHRDCINILKEMVPHDYIIHRHCFTDSWSEAQEWMSTFPNLFLGFTGLITQYNKRARMIQEVVRKMPLEKILLETDAPYFRPNTRGMSHPGMAIHVAAQIAYLRKVNIQVVLLHARANTSKMYGI